MYQVICIGAGPSGILCAYLLAKAGINVSLIEKRAFAGKKLCGCGLSSKTCRLIEGIVDLRKLRGCCISGSYLCFKNEHLCYVSQNRESYSVLKNDFDNALLKAAKERGCDIYMPAEVKEINEKASKVIVKLQDNRQLESDFLVLAEGITGRLYKQIGYYGNRVWTMALEVDVFPDKIPNMFSNSTLFDFGFFKRGYGWIFPKNDHLNIGAYYYFSPHIDRTQIKDLELFVKGFKWANQGKIGKIKAYPLPYKVDYAKFNTGRTLLVGDAAGTVDNFYGEGLYYGFLSSQLASEVLIDCINKGSIDSYTKKLKRKILSQTKISRINAKLFYNYQHFGYYYLVRNTLMNNYYLKLINGETTLKNVFFYTLATFPFSFFHPNLDGINFSEIDRYDISHCKL